MKLWLLTREPCHTFYDTNDGFVIRAETSVEARKIANAKCADEGALWEDELRSKCEQFSNKGEPGIILTDFHAG